MREHLGPWLQEMATGGGSGAETKIEAQQRDCKSVGGRIVASLCDAIKQLSAEREGTSSSEREGTSSSEVGFDYRPSPLRSWHDYIITTSTVGIESVSTEYTVYPKVCPSSGVEFD